MRKIPTLFIRDPQNMRQVTREIHPDCQWVVDGEGIATLKYDGVCVMLSPSGNWWARRGVKAGKATPPNFVRVESDDVTGEVVGWEPIEQSAFARWHADAVAWRNESYGVLPWIAGTYELVGPKINGNPEKVDGHHELRSHSGASRLPGAPRDYDGLAAYLAGFPGEGIVWHHPDGQRMAKLKRRDFPAPQNKP